MKKLVYFLGMFLVAGILSIQVGVAQNTGSLTKQEKNKIEKLRKEKEKKMQRALSKAYYAKLLKEKYFVFMADYVVGPNGTAFVVSPDINFFSVNGNNVVIQFGMEGVVGLNGVGGITARGTILDYKFNQGKKNNMSVTTDINLIGPGLPPHIYINVSDDGTAQLNMQTGNGALITMYGQIVSPRKAVIFTGQSIF